MPFCAPTGTNGKGRRLLFQKSQKIQFQQSQQDKKHDFWWLKTIKNHASFEKNLEYFK